MINFQSKLKNDPNVKVVKSGKAWVSGEIKAEA
jgi:hypothetical protein